MIDALMGAELMQNVNGYLKHGTLGVCIELRNNNYGSMLQSYATQILLSQYGIKYELIEYRKKYTPNFFFKSIPRIFNHVIWEDKFAEFKKKSVNCFVKVVNLIYKPQKL